MGNKISVRSSTHNGNNLQIQTQASNISNIKSHNRRMIHRFHADDKYRQNVRPPSPQQQSIQLKDVSVQDPHMEENEQPNLVLPVVCCLLPKKKSSSDSQIVIPKKTKNEHKCKEEIYKRIKDIVMYKELKKIESTDDVISCYVLSINTEDAIPEKNIKVRQVQREEIVAYEAQTDPAYVDDNLITTVESVDDLNYEENTIEKMHLNKNENLTTKSEMNVTKRTVNVGKINDNSNDYLSYNNIRKRNALVLWEDNAKTEVVDRKQSNNGLMSTEKLNENNGSMSNLARISSEELMHILTEPMDEALSNSNAMSMTSTEDGIKQAEVKSKKNLDVNSVHQSAEDNKRDSKSDMCHDCISPFKQENSTVQKRDVMFDKFHNGLQKSESLYENNSNNEELMITQDTIDKLIDTVVEKCEVKINSIIRNKKVIDDVTETENDDYCSLHSQF